MNFYRNERGQTVLHIAIRKWPDRASLIVTAFQAHNGARVVLRTQSYTTEALAPEERMQTLKTLALLAALEIGEPDPFITGNTPDIKEPVINVTHRRKQS